MKAAIWGAGKMGWVHAKAYRKLSGIEIAYLIEQDKEKAQDFVKEFPCQVLTNAKLLNKGEVDIIDICLPTFIHKKAIEEALNICPNILCEKPVCLTREEFKEIQALNSSKQGTIMVGQVLRFWNGYVKAKELLEAGIIGKPRFITCQRRQKMPAWSSGNWLADRNKSGGLLLDLCIHDVDYLNWILGKPDTIAGYTVCNENGIEIHEQIILSYEKCCATIVGSWGMPDSFYDGKLQTMLEIVGDRGMISYDGSDQILLIEGEKTQYLKLDLLDAYEQEITYFVDCITNRRLPERASLKTVEGTMEILWAVSKTQNTGDISTI